MDKVEYGTESTNLSTCDREPIHIPGKIQCHGFLIALDEHLGISHCSVNIGSFLPVEATQMLGKPVAVLEDLLKTPGTEMLISQFIKTGMTVKGFAPQNPYPVYLKNQYFNLIISRSAGFFILEFEPEISDLGRDLQQFIGASISEMLADADLGRLLQNTACQIKKIIGYDRVMVYKFHEDGHGEVVAEEKTAELTPLLGLHYPASDIPKQARALYKTNLTRLIANVNDLPAAILSVLDPGLYPLDLTHAGLRAVSPIHIQYLKNMGVDSSFSISLMDKNELWGLIACHNYSPRFINYKEREAAKLIGQVLSSALGFRKNKEDENKKYRFKIKVDELVRQLVRDDILKEALLGHAVTMLDALEAGGAALVYDGDVHTLGVTPPTSFILQLVDWLQNNCEPVLCHSDKLGKLFPEGAAFSEYCSGILSCRINRELREYMIWFRPEVISTIQWAGNPEKVAEPDPANILQISPRKSFEAWSETVRGTSVPWKTEDIESAMHLREEVSFTINRKATELRLLNEKLKLAYDELTTFSYTISHDLRNPLSSINGFAQLLLSEENLSPDDLKFMLERILANTQKMAVMIKEVLEYSQAGSQPITRKPIDVKSILEEIRQELIVGTNHPDLKIDIGQTPPINGDHTMVMQIFSNVIGNAVKYSSKSACSHVTINGEKVMDGVQYVISDNGIGIEQAEISKIFDLFSRLDTASEFEGSGVGLAIVKKLIGKHEGEIRVESEPGKGTSFYLVFKY
jgi:two-component system, chemotaxis family, sensor kinase Cph1